MSRSLVYSFSLFILGLLLAGCETTKLSQAEKERLESEKQMRLASMLEEIQLAEDDVYNTLHHIFLSAGGIKDEETFGYVGAFFATHHFYPELLEEALNERGIDEVITVRYVVPDSPADLAGLEKGDQLMGINGDAIPTRGLRPTKYAMNHLKKALIPDEPNRLLVRRAGQEIELEVEPVEAAYYGLIVWPHSEVFAETDGKMLFLSQSLLEMADDYKQLSYICAYAVAKGVMRHAKMKKSNMSIGSIFDIAAFVYGINTMGAFENMGRKAHQLAFEVEADMIALYILANAEIDISEYPAFWEETLPIYRRDRSLVKMDSERLGHMRKTIAEIDEKRINGEPIYPTEYLSGEMDTGEEIEESS